MRERKKKKQEQFQKAQNKTKILNSSKSKMCVNYNGRKPRLAEKFSSAAPVFRRQWNNALMFQEKGFIT